MIIPKQKDRHSPRRKLAGQEWMKGDKRSKQTLNAKEALSLRGDHLPHSVVYKCVPYHPFKP
jgi:hypothetical protein